MKRIVLLSVGFPYGNHEPFLKGELNYYKQIILASAFIGDERSAKNNLPQGKNITLWHCPNLFFRGNKFIRTLFAVLSVFTCDFWRELFKEDIKPITIHKVIALLSYISKTNQIVAFVSKEIKRCGYSEDELIFYSYWMDHLALAAVKLAKKNKGMAVTRCHGHDVYTRDGGYVIMQRYLTQNMDYIFPISEDGKKTICSLFKNSEEIAQKIHVFRLGTEDYGINPEPSGNDIFTIVSCSNVVPLKRVNMIFEAISQIHEFKIHWIHFGDGPDFQILKERVTSKKSGHCIKLMGRKNNEYVMKYYQSTPIHALINLSTSEGIPVSMMEALSFGIPCIGTDVGGVHEIIQNHVNGILLSDNCTVEEVANAIRSLKFMSAERMNILRKTARKFWEDNYRASQNYKEFISYLSKEV